MLELFGIAFFRQFFYVIVFLYENTLLFIIYNRHTEAVKIHLELFITTLLVVIIRIEVQNFGQGFICFIVLLLYQEDLCNVSQDGLAEKLFLFLIHLFILFKIIIIIDGGQGTLENL